MAVELGGTQDAPARRESAILGKRTALLGGYAVRDGLQCLRNE
jgi:hypothetical protein